MRLIDVGTAFELAEAYTGNEADRTLKISVELNAATYWRAFNARRGEGGSSADGQSHGTPHHVAATIPATSQVEPTVSRQTATATRPQAEPTSAARRENMPPVLAPLLASPQGGGRADRAAQALRRVVRRRHPGRGGGARCRLRREPDRAPIRHRNRRGFLARVALGSRGSLLGVIVLEDFRTFYDPASCVVCHNQRGWFWRGFVGWENCPGCNEHYYGKCFMSLKEATKGDWRSLNPGAHLSRIRGRHFRTLRSWELG